MFDKMLPLRFANAVRHHAAPLTRRRARQHAAFVDTPNRLTDDESASFGLIVCKAPPGSDEGVEREHQNFLGRPAMYRSVTTLSAFCVSAPSSSHLPHKCKAALQEEGARGSPLAPSSALSESRELPLALEAVLVAGP
jgi:hypothetical protein